MSYELAQEMLRREGFDVRSGGYYRRYDDGYDDRYADRYDDRYAGGGADPAVRGFLDDVSAGIDSAQVGIDGGHEDSDSTSSGTSSGTSPGTSSDSEYVSDDEVPGGSEYVQDKSPSPPGSPKSEYILGFERMSSPPDSPKSKHAQGGLGKDSLTFNSAPPTPRSGGTSLDPPYDIVSDSDSDSDGSKYVGGGKKNISLADAKSALESQIGDIYF
jgi:hypothetical protein